MNQPALTTSARTVLRVIAGFLFAAHGWQKFSEFTIPGTQAAFTQMGVPARSPRRAGAGSGCVSKDFMSLMIIVIVSLK